MSVNQFQNLELMSFGITVYSEKIPNNGEDAILYSVNDKASLVGVFDGVGGSGAKRYKLANNRTGAYIASRCVASSVKNWFECIFGSKEVMTSKDVVLSFSIKSSDSLKCRIKDSLMSLNNRLSTAENLVLKSSFTKDFPTTMSAVVVIPYSFYERDICNDQKTDDEMKHARDELSAYEHSHILSESSLPKQVVPNCHDSDGSCDNRYALNFYWAGDSRGYIMDKEGLHQVTIDDNGVEDVLESISADGLMNNVICHVGSKKNKGDFYINYRQHIVGSEPFMVFTATDGCFGYISSPMEFEYLLLDCLMKSENAEQFQNELQHLFEEYAQDDYSLTALLYGFNSFDEVKDYYNSRYSILKSMCEEIQKLENSTNKDEIRKKIWHESYKDDYCVYLNSH